MVGILAETGRISMQNRFAGISLCVLLILVALYLLRKNKLSAEYSVIWILTGVLMTLFLVIDWIPFTIMRLVGATNPSSMIFMLGFILLIAIVLSLLVRGSELSVKLRLINQELALLRERFDRHEGQGKDSSADA